MKKDPSRERQSPDWLRSPDRSGDGGEPGEDGEFGGREECQSGDWRSHGRSQRQPAGCPRALAELKQSILEKAFSGELTAAPDTALAEAGV